MWFVPDPTNYVRCLACGWNLAAHTDDPRYGDEIRADWKKLEDAARD